MRALCLKASHNEFFEKRIIEKRKKFEKELHSELSKWQSAQLKKATSNFIPFHLHSSLA